MTLPRLLRNPWLLVPLAIIAGVVASAVQAARVPKRDDWRAAVEHIRGALQPRDGITWTPYYAGEGRLFLHGLPGFHVPDIAEHDFARYDRVWLMGAFGHGAADLPNDAGHEVVSSQEFGGIVLDLIEVGGQKVVGDLHKQLESAVVSRVSLAGQTKRCDFWSGRGWHCDLRKSPEATRDCLGLPIRQRLKMRRDDPECGLDPWLHVSRDLRVIGDGPRRCIFAHPMQEATLRIEWPGAPAGETLVVDYGFEDKVITDQARAEPRTKSATVDVLRGGNRLGGFEQKPEKGWRRWETVLPRGDAVPLVFEISTEATVDAHFCFDPTIRASRGAQ